MKQFLYLDNDIVDSIIAQKEKGLIKESSREQQQRKSKVDGTTSSTSIGGGISGSVFDLFKSQVQADKSDTQNNESSSHSVYRNVITKTLHDAAFDIAMDYVKPATSLTQLQFGSYIEINDMFIFADFKYLESFFAKDGLYEKMVTLQQSNNKNSALSSNGQPKQGKNMIKRECEYLRDICNLARGIVPYDRMLISTEGYIIPLRWKMAAPQRLFSSFWATTAAPSPWMSTPLSARPCRMILRKRCTSTWSGYPGCEKTKAL